MIKFDEKLFDTQNEYDLKSHIFKAAKNGLYKFEFSAESFNKAGKTYIKVVKNGNETVHRFGVKTDNYARISSTWFQSLKKGDKLKLELSDGKLYATCSNAVYFSGMLV